jgi:hypothetical protein
MSSLLYGAHPLIHVLSAILSLQALFAKCRHGCFKCHASAPPLQSPVQVCTPGHCFSIE